MQNNNAPVISNPVMLDRVIAEIQNGLVAGLPWLDVAFGRAQRITRMLEGKKIITPNVYCGGWANHGENDYIEVSPDSNIGNFSFFDINDPHEISAGPWAQDIKTPFGLVIWFDLRRVYGTYDNRNTEQLKAAVLRILSGRTGFALSDGKIIVNQIYERAENIYRGYTLSEIDNQYLMHPYGGFRFEGILEYQEPCIG